MCRSVVFPLSRGHVVTLSRSLYDTAPVRVVSAYNAVNVMCCYNGGIPSFFLGDACFWDVSCAVVAGMCPPPQAVS